MKLTVYNLQNQAVGELEVADEVFAAEVKPHLHHDMVRMQLAKKRRGTAKTKGRSEVAGSGKKMYRQKGTGRARHSTSKAPQFVGGGTVFGPQPRSYDLKVPKKARKAALRSALSEKVQAGGLKVVDAFALSQVKTKEAATALQALETRKALVVDQKGNDNLRLSVRNLRDYKYIAAEGLNVADVLRFEHLVLTRAAVEAIQGALMP